MSLKELKAMTKWIPCEENLPPYEKEVLCTLSSGSMKVLYLDCDWGKDVWVDGDLGTGTFDVIAWQRLPEPYKN